MGPACQFIYVQAGSSVCTDHGKILIKTKYAIFSQGEYESLVSNQATVQLVEPIVLLTLSSQLEIC